MKGYPCPAYTYLPRSIADKHLADNSGRFAQAHSLISTSRKTCMLQAKGWSIEGHQLYGVCRIY